MKTLHKTLLATAISGLALSSAVSVQAESFDEFVKGSSVDLNFRYRVESANVEGGADAALANTLKSRATFKSGSLSGFSVLVEGDNVIQITDDFYDKENGNSATDYDLVLDQETTQINQAYIQYSGFDSTIKAGNQRIVLDNQRHVGGVAFRQDEATFDAISVMNKSIEGTTIFAAIANNRNSITDDNTEEDITFLNVKHSISKDIAATGFYYGIEFATGAQLDTFGLRASGAIDGISFEAELATQDNETNETFYYHLNAGTKLGSVKTTLGYEVMGSDDGAASFNTPLGTNHKFLGWSDTYLSATQWGANGIQDIYASAVTKVAGVKLVGQLHSFSASEGGDDMGTELGFMAAKKFGAYGASLKLAQFNAGDAGATSDVTKIWLTGTAKF
jgi:hypothetical protein